MIGRKGENPVPPSNFVADMGGGGLTLAFGIVCAILEAVNSKQGQVVDAAMVEGAAVLSSGQYGLRAMGLQRDERGTNLGDTGAFFYEVYETKDDKYIAVGAIEPQFYKALVERMGLDLEKLPKQMDVKSWPAMKEKFTAVFKTKTRDEWSAIFAGSDACASPVLAPYEVAEHPHNQERQSFTEVDNLLQPSPAPKFSRTKPTIQRPPPMPGQHTDEVLREWGFDTDEIDKLHQCNAIG